MNEITLLRNHYAETLANPRLSLGGWGLYGIPFKVCQLALGEYHLNPERLGIWFYKDGELVTDEMAIEDAKLIVVSKKEKTK